MKDPPKKPEDFEKSQKMSPISKKRSPPKIKPSLPVSLPLSLYHKYLNSRNYNIKNVVKIEQNENGSVVVTTEIEKCKKNDLPKKLFENAQDNNCQYKPVIEKENIYTEIQNVALTQEDMDILRIIKLCNMSKHIENLHQDIMNNNNITSCNSNLSVSKLEGADSETKKGNQEKSGEKLPFADKDNCSYLTKSISPTYPRNINILMYSNLNKLVFKCLYKTIDLNLQKKTDISTMSKELSQMGQNLVNDILSLINKRDANYKKNLYVTNSIKESGVEDKEDHYTDCEILPRRQPVSLGQRNDSSTQTKINQATTKHWHSLDTATQTLPEHIETTEIFQESPQRISMIEHFQPAQILPQMMESVAVQPQIYNRNHPENTEFLQVHRAQSMPDINPERFPFEYYRNVPPPYYYNPAQMYNQEPNGTSFIGKQQSVTNKNEEELQKRIKYYSAFNYLNSTQNPTNNVTRFSQNIRLRSNNMMFENMIKRQRFPSQQTTSNHRFYYPKKNVRY